MFVKDANGNLVNLETGLVICNWTTRIEVVMACNNEEISSLYVGDNCQAYMAELEKELEAFGKLIRVKIPELVPENADYSTHRCTCGKGLYIEQSQHNEECPFYCPF